MDAILWILAVIMAFPFAYTMQFTAAFPAASGPGLRMPSWPRNAAGANWSYPGLADGLSVAIQSAARATSLEVFSKFIGERYPSAECRRWRLYQSSMY